MAERASDFKINQNRNQMDTKLFSGLVVSIYCRITTKCPGFDSRVRFSLCSAPCLCRFPPASPVSSEDMQRGLLNILKLSRMSVCVCVSN